MSWRITPTQPVPVDPVFNNVSLLLHGNGTNGSATITDSSPTPKTVTAVGAAIDTSIFKYGNGSISFNGSSYLSISDTSIMDFRDANFTVEAWVRPSNLTAPPKNIIGNFAGSAAASTFFIQMNTGGNFAASVYAASTTYSVFTSSSAIPNEWIHVAIVRNGTSLRIYLNGVSSASTTLPNGAVLNSGSGNIQIGREQSSYYWNGYIDDLRITKGIDRYNATFTPPTAPFPDI